MPVAEAIAGTQTAASDTRRRPRALLFLIPALIGYFLFSSVSNWHSLLLTAELSEPVTVDIAGPSDPSSIAVTLLTPGVSKVTGQKTETPLGREPGTVSFRWTSHWVWVQSLRVYATQDALSRIQSVRVESGASTHSFLGEELRSREIVTEGKSSHLPDGAGPVYSVEIPLKDDLRGAINVPDMSLMAWRSCRIPALVSVFLLAAILAIRKFASKIPLSRWLDGEVRPDRSEKGRRNASRFFFAGLIVVLAGLGLFYAVNGRFAFTQDDNFCQFLPVILRSADTLMTGKFPVWNPYQLLGAPTATVGTYALTYPLTYIAWGAARLLFGNGYATLDIFVLIHLIAGYACCFYAMRNLGIAPVLCAAGSVCWALSGWFLTAGRSQFNFTPLAVFLPLLADGVRRAARGCYGWKWAAGTGAVLGVLFHAGHAEFWVYCMMFAGIAVVLQMVGQGFSPVGLVWWLSAFLLGIGIAAPLLVLQAIETNGILRQGGVGWAPDLFHMLLPLGPLPFRGADFLGSVSHSYVNEMFYSGTLFTVVAMGACLIWVSAFVFDTTAITRRRIAQNSWLIMAAIAFLLATGPDGVLWPVLSGLPVFDHFRWPIKYTPFLQFFAILGGGVVLDRMRLRIRTQAVLAGVVAVLMLLHVPLNRAAWYTFAERPYPALPDDVSALVKTGSAGRVMPIAPFRSAQSGFALDLGLNFPTVYGILSAGGYDTFIDTKPQFVRASQRLSRYPIAAARAYGIDRMIWSSVVDAPHYSGNQTMFMVEDTAADVTDSAMTLRGDPAPLSKTKDRAIFDVPHADPMVFRAGHPEAPLPFRLDQAGVDINVSSRVGAENLVVNFLRWPWMKAAIDGQPAAVTSDPWDRIVVSVPSGASEVRVFYAPPWSLSFGIATVLILAGIGAGTVAGRLRPERREVLA